MKRLTPVFSEGRAPYAAISREDTCRYVARVALVFINRGIRLWATAWRRGD